ncbi:vomeronasal type-1 receptor 1-like [Trichosurus vulpecula]|uniref:vomeronasal type-1 receptor 1-like n=1 Tax=Trichosurus vulpecula TaxID=9337 RepID=UPI00186AD6FA|nr:vomeronasal type-1 receptor 1-like [Trichosurus vulpecula]
MLLHEMTLGIIFLSQAGVGFLGNFFLSFYIFTFFTSHRPRPTDTILAQLALANAILLLSHGMPMAILYLKKQYFLGNAGCKIVFFLRRVSRGLSMNSTCLLSIFQAVIISPSSSRLAKIKVRTPKFIRSSCLFCWILNIIIEINGTACITGSRNSNNSHKGGVDLLYCYWENVLAEFVILSSFRDLLLVGCMVWASNYMVFLLYGHHQRVQYIHSTSLSLKVSPDIRATHTILILVGTFIFAYCVSCSFVLYKVYVIQTNFWVMNVTTFITLCFPTICPFLLIHRDTKISSSCYASQWSKCLYL